MEKRDFKILFLDDEINDKNSNVAELAFDTIKKAGYSIEAVSKMSDVIEAYYQKYYHLFILDIDMGEVKDSTKERGTVAGEFLKRLSSISNVIVFSGAGEFDDWLHVANYHFYSYIQKRHGGEKLLEVIDKIFNDLQNKPFVLPSLERADHNDISYVYNEENMLDKQLLERKFGKTHFVDSLETLLHETESSKPKLIVIVLKKPLCTFNNTKRLDLVEKISEHQTKAKIIFCIDNSFRTEVDSVIGIVNSRPFRLLNIDSATFESDLEEAAAKAALWYGEREIFDLPEEGEFNRKEIDEKFESSFHDLKWEDFTADLLEDDEGESDE
ncbi:MAG: response regulator [Candidatus Cloacimonadales bacterium]|jgi:DNA-binding NtrC family response regulator|nr:response regulator [Candidatus Cloacimonadales bacterium]